MVKLPKRFALSTLLLAMFFASLVFGYAQWRRQWLAQQIKQLEGSGSSVVKLSDSWFWPSVTPRATVVFKRDDNDAYVTAGKRLTAAEAKAHYDATRARLHAIGVSEVACGLLQSKNNVFRIETFEFNEPEK